MPFLIPLRKSSINAQTSEVRPKSNGNNNSRKDIHSRSIHKAQRILGTTDISLDNDYHRRPEKQTGRKSNFLSAPDLYPTQEVAEEDLHSPGLRVRASSPLLGQDYRVTSDSAPPLVELSRKLHLSGSASPLHNRYSRASPDTSSTSLPREHGATAEGGLNPAYKPPKGPMKDAKRRTRPPRIDLSLLFPKPQPVAAPLLSPQRMVHSPSAISDVSEMPAVKMRKPEARLAGKRLTKAQPMPKTLGIPENTHHSMNRGRNSSVSTGSGWDNPSMEKTVRTSEMDLALQKNLDGIPTPRSAERVQYSPRNFSLRSRDQLQKSDSKSDYGESAHSSQRTLRQATSGRSLKDSSAGLAPFHFGQHDEAALNQGPRPPMSKKSSKSTLKNTDLNTSSVLCLSSSEDESEEMEPYRAQLKMRRNKRDSVSTYGDFEAEICTAAAAQATRGTLRSVERPSSRDTHSSRGSSKQLKPWQDSDVPQARKTSTATANTRSRRSAGVPAILEPDFLHDDPMFDQINQTKPPARTLSQKEIKRRSRLMAVTRQEEHFLDLMRQRKGKITPSIFNEPAEPDRRSVVSGSNRDSYYCSDTSFLRLSPSIPNPVPTRAAQYKDKGLSTPKSDAGGRSTNSAPSPRASLVSSRSLPSPATSRSSPLTPTLPIHRFSPIPSQKPPPRCPPPPVPDLQRQHSRRRTDSSGAIALDDAPDAQKARESGDYPVWALGWANSEGASITAVH
ncbi:hypothetical protein BJX99DRAFT_229626 [Aspergillus californicus]